jgi:hypothetical protein
MKLIYDEPGKRGPAPGHHQRLPHGQALPRVVTVRSCCTPVTLCQPLSVALFNFCCFSYVGS